jgi:isopentenyl-diphosphate delta-isomerase
MEMVDIVDNDCNILYSVSKDEAHAKGLLHKTVICEVRDKEGKTVLVQQAPDRQDAGQYVSPVGGHVTSGESDEDGLRREAMEEIGAFDFEYKLKGKFIFNRFVKNRQENHYFIVYEMYNAGKLNLGSEAISHHSFTEAELKKSLKENRQMFGKAYLIVVENLYPNLLK